MAKLTDRQLKRLGMGDVSEGFVITPGNGVQTVLMITTHVEGRTVWRQYWFLICPRRGFAHNPNGATFFLN